MIVPHISTSFGNPRVLVASDGTIFMRRDLAGEEKQRWILDNVIELLNRSSRKEDFAALHSRYVPRKAKSRA